MSSISRRSIGPHPASGRGVLSVFVFSPPTAFAQAPAELSSAIEEIRARVTEFRQAIADLTRLTGVARATRIRQLLDELTALRERVVGLRVRSEPLVPEIRSVLRTGASGDDVRRVQEFLRQFPDIYPEGDW